MPSDRWPTDAEKRRRWERENYTQNTGRDGEARFPDDPDWNYRGTKAERDALGKRFHLGEEDDEAPVVIDGQEELFGA